MSKPKPAPRNESKIQEPGDKQRLKIPLLPPELSTDRPAVEDLPQGKDAAAEAARPRDD